MKNTKIIIVLVGVLLLFTACSNNIQTSTSSTTVTTGIIQQPERTAELYGQVKSIVGNEVTILLAEQQATETELSDAEKEQKKADKQALSQEEKLAQKNELIKFTGKIAIITIPVGTPITTSESAGTVQTTQTQQSANTLNLKDFSLADIRAGMFLKIWTEEGGSVGAKSAEYVRVLQSQQ
jgi:hypothetical protein